MDIDYKLSQINLEILKIKQASIIKNFLINIPEDKILILDKNANNIINGIINSSELKKVYGVKEIFYTDNFPKYKEKYYIYFVFSTLESILFINNYRDFFVNSNNKHKMCFLEKRNMNVEIDLHFNEMWDHVDVFELIIEMIPIENDIINMYMANSIRKIFIDQNIKYIKHVVKCIEIIQRLYGKIPNITAFGNTSIKIKNAIIEENKINKYEETQINKLIIFDRTIDTITPCLTQLVYEGAIDEIFGIVNSKIKLENDYVPLHSGYQYYLDIRDKHINVSKILLKTHSDCYNLKNINIIQYTETPDNETQQFLLNIVKQNKIHTDYLYKHVAIHNILSKKINSGFFKNTLAIEKSIMITQINLNPIQTFFSNITDDIEIELFNYIDKSISNGESIYYILGCISLYFQICGCRMTKKGYGNLMSTLDDKYNCYKIINHMEKLEIMKKKEITINKSSYINGKTINDTNNIYTFNKLLNKLDLIQEIDLNTPNQQTLHYLYGGYAPISGQLIQNEIKNNNTNNNIINKNVTLICFVGGCTYSEIIACRSFSNIIILTTEIFNKQQFFDSM